jgi:hypothetical protein
MPDIKNKNPSDALYDMSLEEIINISNKIGLEYVEVKKQAERGELLRLSKRAEIMNRIEREHKDEGSVGEAKLKRLAEADSEYIELLESISKLRAKSETLRIRYESYKNLFDAKKIMFSLKKAEISNL